MATRPLLALPNPRESPPPRSSGGGGNLRLPTRQRQVSKFGPQFNRLRQALARPDGPMALRRDPDSLAPDRVIVFEIAGRIEAFRQAVAKVDGLEFLAELEAGIQPDADFAVLDTRRDREGRDRADKFIVGRLYLAMPDLTAFKQLLSLWDRWETTGRLDRGFAPFGEVFKHLYKLQRGNQSIDPG